MTRKLINEFRYPSYKSMTRHDVNYMEIPRPTVGLEIASYMTDSSDWVFCLQEMSWSKV